MQHNRDESPTLHCVLRTVSTQICTAFSYPPFSKCSTFETFILSSDPNAVGESGGPCRKAADVAFLIDSTSNMDYNNYITYVIPFLKKIVANVDNTGRVQVAAITFADDALVSDQMTLLKKCKL